MRSVGWVGVDFRWPLSRVSKTERGLLIPELLLEERGQTLSTLGERLGATGHYKDLADLQSHMDRVAEEGRIWMNSKGQYFVV